LIFNGAVTKTNCFAVHPFGGDCFPRIVVTLCGLTNPPLADRREADTGTDL